MANQEFYSRIIHKHDIEANWNTAAEKSNFIPKQGEIIVYDKDDNYDYERIKIGDGITNVANLPFLLDGVEEIISDLGAITIDIGDADATTPNGINADSVGGLTKDQLVAINLENTDSDENNEIIKINSDLFGGNYPDYYAKATDVEVITTDIKQINSVINNNTIALGGLKFQPITQTGYDAISVKDNSTLYIIVG